MKPLLVAALCGTSLLAVDNPVSAPVINPADVLKQYAKYQRMTAEPKDMGANMPFPCATAGSPEFQEKSKKFGPHLGHYLHHYRNDDAVKSTDSKTWAVGSVLMKEKLRSKVKLPDGQSSVSGVAGMIKRPAGTLPKSGDWEFFYAWQGKLETNGLASCAGCHSGAKKDFVFTSFSEQKAK